MPLLDVNDAFDPIMMDEFQVIRRVQTISNKGRVVVAETPMTATGVVTAASPDDLQRLPEAEYMNKAISIYTPFRLQGPAQDEAGVVTLPDQVLWHDSVFVVRAVDDFSGYGRGFVSAVAVSVGAVDPPPIPAPVGSA